MKYYIGMLSLGIVWSQSVLGDTLDKEKDHQSNLAVILGVIVLISIIFILLRRQKRRFND